MVCLWRQLVLLGLLQQLPDLSLPSFQVSHIVRIEMASLVNAAADVIDVGCCSADGSRQFFLFGVVHLDDVTVNGHLAKISLILIASLPVTMRSVLYSSSIWLRVSLLLAIRPLL